MTREISHRKTAISAVPTTTAATVSSLSTSDVDDDDKYKKGNNSSSKLNIPAKTESSSNTSTSALSSKLKNTKQIDRKNSDVVRPNDDDVGKMTTVKLSDENNNRFGYYEKEDDKNIKAMNQDDPCSNLEKGFSKIKTIVSQMDCTKKGITVVSNMECTKTLMKQMNKLNSINNNDKPSDDSSTPKPAKTHFSNDAVSLLVQYVTVLFADLPRDLSEVPTKLKPPEKLKDFKTLDYINKILVILVMIVLSIHLVEYTSMGIVTGVMNRKVLSTWQYTNITSTLSNLQNDIYDFQYNVKEVMTSTIQSKDSSLQTSNRVNRELTSQLTDITIQNSDVITKNVDKLNTDISVISKERDELKILKESIINEKNQQQQTNTNLQNEINEKTNQITSLTNEKNELQQHQNTLSASLTHGSNDKLQTLVNNYKSQIESKTNEIFTLQQTNNEKLNTISELSNQVNKVINDRDTLKANIAAAASKNSILGGGSSGGGTFLTETERITLQSQITTNEIKLATKENELQKLKNELMTERLNNGNLLMQVKDIESGKSGGGSSFLNMGHHGPHHEYMANSNKEDNNEQQVKVLTEEKIELKSKIHNLKEKLEDKETTIEELKNQLDEYTSSENKMKKELKHYKKAFKLMDELE